MFMWSFGVLDQFASKYRVSSVSALGIVIVAWGMYFIFGFSDPYMEAHVT